MFFLVQHILYNDLHTIIFYSAMALAMINDSTNGSYLSYSVQVGDLIILYPVLKLSSLTSPCS